MTAATASTVSTVSTVTTRWVEPAPRTAACTRPRSLSHREWGLLAARQPQLAETGKAYLQQISVSLSRASVDAADQVLRMFCTFLTEQYPDVSGFREVSRPQIEDFKLWLVTRPGSRSGSRVTTNTVRQRLGMLRTFLDRIMEWDWPDAPRRQPIFSIDLPLVDHPLPKFLDDAQAAALLRAASADSNDLRRLIVNVLLRTGLRVGEFCALDADAVVQMQDDYWLRVPVGKLHNDRYLPLHPHLVELLKDWTTKHPPIGTRLLTRRGRPLNLGIVKRAVEHLATEAGIGHVHPHQLRHTFATQAINRGMRIEAIGAMLGHRTLRMTLVYARIANKTVAQEYRAVSDSVDTLYAEPALLGSKSKRAPVETEQMRTLRLEHRRMLGNGWCTRPRELDCAFETICEGCGFFQTTIEFRPTLQAQHDDALSKDQDGRAQLFQTLLDRPSTAVT